MTNRIPTPSPAERAAFGLIAWLEQTKITLPLKSVECAFDVCGDVVSVELDQIFHQNSAHPLDCLYTFPLPATAAVYRCEMHVNGRLIRARVEEQERARELAREKKAAGYRTALVEMERDNLFALSLGNVQPGDLIVIRFAYFQTLTRLGDWTSLSIPFCPGVRYIPGTPLLRAPKGRGVADDTDQVPDASRISPPRMDRLHPDAARLSVEGTIEHPLDDVKDISSPSHPVFVRPGAKSSTISLADNSAVPESDFVVRWTELPPTKLVPKGWLTRGKLDSFALIRLRAPARVSASDTYAQDMYFLIDRSGSMEGLKWQKAAQAFREFLKVLGKDDRVWATFFETRFRDLAEKPLPATEVLSDPAVKNLEALGATGGTELLRALEHVLGKITAYSKDRPASLLVITDGQVGNEAAVLQRLSRHTNLRVHVFGIDVAINDGFLLKLAAQHHGSSCLLSPQDDIAGAVARLGDRLRRPVLTSIRVSDGWELAGQELPDLYAGEILSLPLRARQPVMPAAGNRLTLESKLPDGTSTQHHFDLIETDAAALRLLWAKRHIDFMLAQGRNSEAIAVAKDHNLACEGAAFVAWDEAEKVPVSGAEHEVYQPSMMPDLCEHMMASAPARSSRLFAGSARFAPPGPATPPPLAVACSIEDRDNDYGAAYSRPLIGRLSEAAKGPMIIQPLLKWRTIIEKDPVFQSSQGAEFLDFLLSWAQAHAAEAETWLTQLQVLQNLLQRTADRPAARRLQDIRSWISRQTDDRFKPEAMQKLRRLEETVLGKSKASAP